MSGGYPEACGCHGGCHSLPHDCPSPCEWPACMSEQQQAELADELIAEFGGGADVRPVIHPALTMDQPDGTADQ